MSKQSGEGAVGVIVVIIVIVVIGIVITQFQRHQQCLDAAQLAAIQQYPIYEYPNTSQREILQTGYKERYIENACQ